MMNTETVNKSANNKARVATALVALLVLIALFFISFTIDEKEDEETIEGILVNFGTTDFGSGEIQPQQNAEAQELAELLEEIEEVSKPAPAPSEPAKSEPVIAKEEIITQKQESVKVPEKKVEKKQPIKKETETKKEVKKPSPTPTEVKKETEEEIKEPVKEEPKPTVNQRALYGGKSTNTSTGEGVTGQPGDQGDPSGVPEQGAYSGTNSGLGDSGIGYSLSGRKMITPPKISDNSNAQGKITIKIKVDQNGNVLSASLGKPTTISNNTLLNKAIAAAKKAKFDKNAKAAEEQFGSMTFVFKVR